MMRFWNNLHRTLIVKRLESQIIRKPFVANKPKGKRLKNVDTIAPNLVHTTRFWNNLHKVRSRQNIENHKKKFGASKPKDKNRTPNIWQFTYDGGISILASINYII